MPAGPNKFTASHSRSDQPFELYAARADGVVLQITPWNAPIFTCGCSRTRDLHGQRRCSQASELTPLTSLAVRYWPSAPAAERCRQRAAGFGHTTGSRLGGACVKKVVFAAPSRPAPDRRSRAKRLLPHVLELAASPPNIVFDDADLERAAIARKRQFSARRPELRRGLAAARFRGRSRSLSSISLQGLPQRSGSAIPRRRTPRSADQQRKQYQHVLSLIREGAAEGADRRRKDGEETAEAIS